MHADERRGFSEFVAARSDSLIRLAYVLTGDQHSAEDLLQTALTKTAARWSRIRTNPEAYVRRVMYHEQVGRWRSPWWGRENVVESPPERHSADATAQVDERLALEAAMRALPARKRAVLVLRFRASIETRSSSWWVDASHQR